MQGLAHICPRICNCYNLNKVNSERQRFIMAIRERHISVDQFQEIVAAPENQGCNLDLVEGIVIEMSKPKLLHCRIGQPCI